MPVRGPMLLHRMALVSFRLFCKHLVYRPPLAENCPYAYGYSARCTFAARNLMLPNRADKGRAMKRARPSKKV